ncbi:host cell division inhibitor Icd-like protein [Enterobacteriaceae bacterium RIT711]|nr:host cell division inhibitor Icd-like protein [Enterobacteriaceae bacterium RIT711]
MNYDNFRLNNVAKQGYSFAVVTTVTTGRRNPCNTSAITDALSVFFVIATNALARHFMVWCVFSRQQTVGHEQVQHHSTRSMVAQAGQLSGWPVSDVAGIPTPVWAIAIYECRNSGDSRYSYTSEIIIMMATLTPSHPQYTWLFLAVRRSDLSDRPHREEVTASDYPTARRLIARDHIAAFAGRLPVQEVHHA